MNGWETTVNTGNADADRATLEQYRRAAESQGMVLQVQPLPTGGVHVRAVPPGQAAPPQTGAGGYGAPPQPGYGAPPPQGGYGAAPQGGYGAPPQPGYGAPPPQGGYGAAPQGGYGAPPPQGGYGASPQGGYGASPASPGVSAYSAPAQAAAPAFGAAAGWQAPPMAYAGGGGGAAGVAAGGIAGAVAGIADLGRARIQHLRKVYGLLAVSAVLAIACGFVAITVGDTVPFRVEGSNVRVQVPMIVAAMLDNPGLLYGAFALLFVATIGASFVSKVRGLNLVALFFVSALMGVELAPMAFVAQVYAGLGATLSLNPVRDSFMMVGAIFIGITAYALISKKDFSYLGATLTMGFFVVFTACIIAAVIGSEILSLAVATAGALLAAGFLLYETSRILKGSMDDPVGDALGLLVQLRNLFMFILRILMSRR